MKHLDDFANSLFEKVAELLPEYRACKDDFQVNEGNVAVMILDQFGNMRGQCFGDHKPRLRDTANIAWKKASQVWLTGIATGEYERKVYNNEVNWFEFGIMKPDLVGWEGGMPVKLADGSEFAVGCSGFRGERDAELVRRAIQSVQDS